MSKFKKMFFRGAVLSSAFFVAAAHAAAPTTVGDLATSVSFDDVALAILAISGTLITLFVTWKGAKFVLRAVKGG